MQQDILKFPCRYPIKVFGKTSQEFENSVYKIISNHCHNKKKEVIKRGSTNNKFTALTIYITAMSRKHIDAINDELKQHPLVEYIL